MGSKLMGTLLTAFSLTICNVAVAQSAAPLSLANSPVVDRAGAATSEASDLRGTGLWIVGAIALGLVIWGASELLLDNEEAFPNSP
jgi:hypothetical protein